MKIGVVMFPTDYSIRPDDLGRACEERGIESIWFPEHTHIPASRKTPYPAGGELPKEYSHTYDPFVALMAAGAVTKKLKLGTGICLAIERDPITLAKEVASVDALSDGRFLFGIGPGWNVEEMNNHGTDYKRRWKVQRERVLAMKQIWTQEEASYEGEFVKFERIWQWPKPAQKPHPPILLGTHTEWGLQRVVDYCDGWMPIGLALPDFAGMIKTLHEKARAAGRDPKSISVNLFWAPPDASELARFGEMGVERGILALPPGTRDEVLPLLDGFAALVRQVS